MVETLHYFTTHGWNFESKGLLSMWDSLCDEDKEVHLMRLFSLISICCIRRARLELDLLTSHAPALAFRLGLFEVTTVDV